MLDYEKERNITPALRLWMLIVQFNGNGVIAEKVHDIHDAVIVPLCSLYKQTRWEKWTTHTRISENQRIPRHQLFTVILPPLFLSRVTRSL